MLKPSLGKNKITVSRQHLLKPYTRGVFSIAIKSNGSIMRWNVLKIKLYLGYKSGVSFTKEFKSGVSFTIFGCHLQIWHLVVQTVTSLYNSPFIAFHSISSSRYYCNSKNNVIYWHISPFNVLYNCQLMRYNYIYIHIYI